ncbi:MAG: squalene synthase HpnC [Verrucomicrobiota bacterium]
MTIEEAYQKCTALAETHYENFPVGRLVKKKARPHIHMVYAFARVADDYADEGYVTESGKTPPTKEQRLEWLNHYEEQLTNAFMKKPIDPKLEWIFLALADTAQKHIIPKQLFYDLLSAFKQDVTKTRYETFDEVMDYCRRSANPVGRLVLHLHDYRDEEMHKLSDCICTALQLANFWQDVAVDALKDRIYIPREDIKNFGCEEKIILSKDSTPEFRKCLEFQVNRTWNLFNKGHNLPSMLTHGLAWEIRLTWLGGTEILRKIEKQNYDTLSRRPKLSKWDVLRLLPWAWFTQNTRSL